MSHSTKKECCAFANESKDAAYSLLYLYLFHQLGQISLDQAMVTQQSIVDNLYIADGKALGDNVIQ
jgi:hypothetical protein